MSSCMISSMVGALRTYWTSQREHLLFLDVAGWDRQEQISSTSRRHERSLEKGHSQSLVHVSGMLFPTTFETSVNFKHLKVPLRPITIKWHMVTKFVVDFNRLVLCKAPLNKFWGCKSCHLNRWTFLYLPLTIADIMSEKTFINADSVELFWW